jgi:hypothetical protein
LEKDAQENASHKKMTEIITKDCFCLKETALSVSQLYYCTESGTLAGPDNAIKKHILGLLSFDKNKGFTLECGQFVPARKTHQVSYTTQK